MSRKRKTNTDTSGVVENAEEALPKMSPLELAYLTAHLVEAGVVKPPNHPGGFIGSQPDLRDNRQTIVSALRFLRDCQNVLTFEKESEKWQETQRIENGRKAAVAKKYSTGGCMPASDLLKVAGVERMRLSPEQLASIGIKRSMATLSPEEQVRARFLYLTRPGRVQTVERTPFPAKGDMVEIKREVDFGSLEDRERMVREGVHTPKAWQIAEGLETVYGWKKAIEARQNGKKKRVGQRRTSKGKFTRTPRGPEGTFGKSAGEESAR